MDITINIPKRLVEEWIDENKEAIKNDMELFFKIPYIPKQARKGDKCFIILNKQIVGYHIIHHVAWINGFKCEITNRWWDSGHYIIRKAGTWIELKEPIQTKPHRGFRYINKQNDKQQTAQMF